MITQQASRTRRKSEITGFVPPSPLRRLQASCLRMFATVLAVTALPVAQAATINWSGAGDGTSWGSTSNWSGGVLPGASDDVVIPLVVANPTITFSGASGTVVVKSVTTSEALSITGGSLKATNGISTSAPLTISGGTVLASSLTTTGAGTLSISGGTLDTVTIASPATVTGTITIKNGLTLASSPKITLAGTLNFSGTQTLGGTGEIYLSNSTYSVLQSQGGGSLATAAVLTIGSNITVDGPGNGYIQGYFGTDSVVNQGAVTAATSGQTVYFSTGTFTNSGTISVSGGSTLFLNNAWTNSGTLTINASTVNLGGTFSGTSLGTFNRTGGTVNITGTVTNTAGTLALTANTGSLFLTSGTITGGTITTAGGANFTVTGGTLDGVTVASPISVSGTVSVKNGLTLSGSPKVTLAGTLNFAGTQTLGGTGEIYLSNTTYSVLQSQGGGTVATASVLTIGSNITIDGPGNAYIQGYFGTDSVVNQGTITAGTSGQNIYFNTGAFTNSGTLGASGGSTIYLNNAWTNTGTLSINASTINLGGTFSGTSLGTFSRTGGTVNITGTITNTGGTLALTANTGPLTLSNGTITGGTITTAGGATFAASGGTLDGVTLSTAASITGTVTIKNGLTLSGNPKITVAGTMNFSGTQTLGGTGELYLSNTTYSVLQSQGGGSIANAAVLTIGPNIVIDGPGNAYVQSYFGTDSVVNQGTITAGTSGQSIYFNTGTFTNEGSVKALGGSTVYLNNAWSNTGTLFVNASTLNLGGTFNAGGVGTFSRTGGTVNITGALTNTGTTFTATANTGNLNLTTGTITGGTLATSGGATFTATGGTLDGVTIASAITSSGTVTVKNGLTFSGNPKLTLAGTMNFSGTQTLGGTGEIYLSNSLTSSLQSIGGGTIANAATLTIGPNITIDGPGTAYIQNYFATDSIINKGKIVAGNASQSIYFSTGTFTNEGTVQATNGGTVYLNNAWSNTGTLQVNAGTLNLGGTFSTSDIGTLSRTGGTVNITGVLTNTGATLALTASTGDFVLQNGIVRGGNITTAGGAKLLLTGGTLDGVTLSGDATATGTITVKNNLTLGSGKLTVSGGSVLFNGSQTLGGTGEVYFGPAVGTLYSVGTGSPGGEAVLTIGPNVTMAGPQGPRVLGYFGTDTVQSFASVTWTKPRLVNISTRAMVGTGSAVLIPGFVVSGSGTETLLIRAAGPVLNVFGITGTLAHPTLTLMDSKGNPIASNTGWGTNADPAQVTAASAKAGAFAFPEGSDDCALVAFVPAGNYTVVVSGVGGTTGVALAEVYEVSSTGTRLTNISTRAQVGTGTNIVIPGFVIRGPGTEKLLVRGIGPALTQFEVAGVLAKPSMNFYDSKGAVLASNTGWGNNTPASTISSTGASVGAFALAAGSDDSALVMSVTEGSYTFSVFGLNDTTGNALAEVYEAP